VFSISKNTGWWTKPKNRVILSVMRHRQNLLDYILLECLLFALGGKRRCDCMRCNRAWGPKLILCALVPRYVAVIPLRGYPCFPVSAPNPPDLPLESPEQAVLLRPRCSYCFVAQFLVKSAAYLVVTNGSGIWRKLNRCCYVQNSRWIFMNEILPAFLRYRQTEGKGKLVPVLN
jgi:hypothetical protein